MTNLLFNTLKNKGPEIIYSNFVKLEGLQILKIYMKYFGYNYLDDEGKDYFRYIEYHGKIDKKIRSINLKKFNNINNIDGKNIKLLLISPAGSEGLDTNNVKKIHILEPYWNEVRTI
jgi:maleate cis-trans isomerase